MSEKPKKYVFIDGVMKLNPAFTAYQNATNPTATPTPPTGPSQSLAVVSSMEDIMDATELQADSTGTPMQMSPSTASAMQNLQDTSFTSEFHNGTEIDGCELLEELTDYFVQFEVPVGMINKIVALKEYRLNFIIDDSGSMRAPTDVYLVDATPYVLRGAVPPPGVKMTRWQEAENRMHILMDIISFIPTKLITITFMNAPEVITLQHDGKSLDGFRTEAHAKIVAAFNANAVRYKTPTYACLEKSFREAANHSEPMMHYLLTDGQPSDKPIEMVANLIKFRQNPAANPVTLLSCSDDDSEVEWMKTIEEDAPFCSELDDYIAEKQEVLADQGPAFPFTKGMWIISMLVGAINPYDLDAMDENLPFSKATLDDLLGRRHTADEYKYYFDRNTHGKLYRDLYPRFLNEATVSRRIVSEAEQKNRETRAGYVNGKPASGGYVVHSPQMPSAYMTPQVTSYPVTSYPVPSSTQPPLYNAPMATGGPVPISQLPNPPANTFQQNNPPTNPGYKPTPTYTNAPSPGSNNDMPPAYGS